MRNNSRHPFIRIILFLLKIFGIITVALILLTITASFFKIKNITVEPGEYYTEDEIINMIIKDRTDNIAYLLYLKDKLLDREQIPFVEKAEIKVLDKNTVYIKIYDKLITGCVSFIDSYMYFDLDGRVVESSDERLFNVPIIMGLEFNKIVLNESLEVQKNSMFDIILNITKAIQYYGLNVDKVEFLKNDEVVVYCEENVFELGKHKFYDEHISLISSIVESLGDEKYRINMKDNSNGLNRYTAIPLNNK